MGDTKPADPLEVAATAHSRVVAAQEEAAQQVWIRDRAARQAHAAGVTSAELQAALNLSKQRISQILNKGKP